MPRPAYAAPSKMQQPAFSKAIIPHPNQIDTSARALERAIITMMAFMLYSHVGCMQVAAGAF